MRMKLLGLMAALLLVAGCGGDGADGDTTAGWRYDKWSLRRRRRLRKMQS